MAVSNKMLFNNEKFKVLHLGRKDQMVCTRLSNSTCEKHLGALVDHRLSMSQQRALLPKKVNAILACINTGMISRPQEVTVLFYAALVSLHLEYCVQF